MRTALDVDGGEESTAARMAWYFDGVWALERGVTSPASGAMLTQGELAGSVRSVQSAGPALPFEDRSFDVVVLHDGGRCRLDEGDVREALRVLTDNGVVCLLGHNPVSPLPAVLGPVNGGWAAGRTRAGYRRLLRSAGATLVGECWVLPSYRQPTWSGNLAWDGGLRFVVRGLGRHSMELKRGVGRLSRLARRLALSNWGKLVLGTAQRLWVSLVPCVVTFGSRGPLPRRLLDQLVDETAGDTGWVLRSADRACNKVTLFRVDRAGVGRRVFYMSRNTFGSDAVAQERVGAGFNGHPEKFDVRMVGGRVVVEAPYYPGRFVNPFNMNDALRAIDWLLAFQHGRTSGPDDPRRPFTTFIAGRIRPELRLLLDRFLEATGGERPRESPEHGDFSYSNIILARVRVAVIDWEFFEPHGDQLFDLSTFLLNWYFDAVEAGRTPDLGGFLAMPSVVEVLRRFCDGAGVDPHIVVHYLPIAAARLEFRQTGTPRPEYGRALEETRAVADAASRGGAA